MKQLGNKTFLKSITDFSWHFPHLDFRLEQTVSLIYFLSKRKTNHQLAESTPCFFSSPFIHSLFSCHSFSFYQHLVYKYEFHYICVDPTVKAMSIIKSPLYPNTHTRTHTKQQQQPLYHHSLLLLILLVFN